MLSVSGPQLSELGELPFVFVSTLEVFGERPSARGRMLHPIGQMPCSLGRAPWSAPTDAPRARKGALEEARAALSGEGDALREPRDALAIRGDAVRRRGRNSRRVTRLSRSSARARSISEVAARTRGAAVTTQSEASRSPPDVVDGIRDAQRGENDAHGEAEKPAPTRQRRFRRVGNAGSVRPLPLLEKFLDLHLLANENDTGIGSRLEPPLLELVRSLVAEADRRGATRDLLRDYRGRPGIEPRRRRGTPCRTRPRTPARA